MINSSPLTSGVRDNKAPDSSLVGVLTTPPKAPGPKKLLKPQALDTPDTSKGSSVFKWPLVTRFKKTDKSQASQLPNRLPTLPTKSSPLARFLPTSTSESQPKVNTANEPPMIYASKRVRVCSILQTNGVCILSDEASQRVVPRPGEQVCLVCLSVPSLILRHSFKEIPRLLK